jgi:hypothetical protein
MTQLQTLTDTAMPVCLCEAHHSAYDALAGGRDVDAIVWVSAHLAVSYRLLHREAAKVAGLEDLLAQQRRIDRRLERAARILERRHAGDGLVAGLDPRRLRRELLVAIEDHVAGEQLLLERLHGAWPVEHAAEMCASYARLLAGSPTRPHPHMPRRGAAGRVAYRLEAWRDHVLDTLDSRHIPVQAR